MYYFGMDYVDARLFLSRIRNYTNSFEDLSSTNEWVAWTKCLNSMPTHEH